MTSKSTREAAELAPGFTPGAKDVPRLIDELSTPDEDRAKAVARALLRAPAPASVAALAALKDAVRPARGRLAALLGQLYAQAQDVDLKRALIELSGDADLKTQLNAVGALGRVRDEESEVLLLRMWREAPRSELRRALLRSLGKAGGAAAARALADAPSPADPEERRLLEQARLILARETTRGEGGSLKDDVALDGVEIELTCRAGLAELLRDEVKALGLATGASSAAPDRVRLKWFGTWRELLRARTMDDVAIIVALDGALPLVDAVVLAISQPKVRQLVERLTGGVPRFRIDWPSAGNAQVWDLAKSLTKTLAPWINDPTGSLWEVRLRTAGATRRLTLVPKALNDDRFAYRAGDVPAASKPTLAAALARLAGVRDDDVVWDPFAGSGTELVERALFGAYARLVGTDLSAEAVAVARVNLERAGVQNVHIEVNDALVVTGLHPTLILTNPPMGRRVARGELKPLLEGFMTHAARELATGGRLVWISPLPERTAARLEELGLSLTYRKSVDMGGFDAEIQVATKA